MQKSSLLFCSIMLTVGGCCHCACEDDKKKTPAPVVAAPVVAPVQEAAAAPVVASPGSSAGKNIPLGVGTSFGGLRALRADAAWNTPVDSMPVDPHSAAYIAAIGERAPLHPDFGTKYEGKTWGIPYVVVAGNEKKSKVVFDYADESDEGPYPIPANPPIEGALAGQIPTTDDGGDQHLLMIDRDNAKLYELYLLRRDHGTWKAGSGAIFDLFGDTHRHGGWTSADAAGLPIFPGLVRYDEAIEQGKIDHALRFTTKNTRRAYVAPASHAASKSTDMNRPPMGARLRLKATVDINAYPEKLRPLLVALKRYGMILADNGGNLFLSGAPDPRWNDAEVNELKRLHTSDFEVVQLGDVTTP